MAPRIEIVTIGDELLLGQTLDTNACFMSELLTARGFRVTRRTTVGDHEASIAGAVSEALARADVVLCTGGLGPTQDDFTKPVVARLFDAPLEIDQRIVEELQQRYARRALKMYGRNITQAEVPRGAGVLPNARGTAPGLVLERDGRYCILLPGVPHELRGLMVEQVLPFLLSKFAPGAGIVYRRLRTTGMAESQIAEKLDAIVRDIAPLTLAFLPSFEGTDLRITSWGELADPAAALEQAEQRIRAVLEPYIYGTGEDNLAAVAGELLRARALTVSVAESCTGGLLGKRLTDIAGSSAYVVGGVIAYDNRVKTAVLGVPEALIREQGAVSEGVVRAMARGAQQWAGSECAIAITGIAGPAGGSAEKPVGLVWHAAAVGERLESFRFVYPGDRDEIRERAAQGGLALLWRMLRV